MPEGCVYWAALVFNSRVIAKQHWSLPTVIKGSKLLSYGIGRDFRSHIFNLLLRQESFLVPNLWSGDPSLSTTTGRDAPPFLGGLFCSRMAGEAGIHLPEASLIALDPPRRPPSVFALPLRDSRGNTRLSLLCQPASFLQTILREYGFHWSSGSREDRNLH